MRYPKYLKSVTCATYIICLNTKHTPIPYNLGSVYQRHYGNTKTRHWHTEAKATHCFFPYIYYLLITKGESLKTSSCVHEFNIRDYIFSSQVTMWREDTRGLLIKKVCRHIYSRTSYCTVVTIFLHLSET